MDCCRGQDGAAALGEKPALPYEQPALLLFMTQTLFLFVILSCMFCEGQSVLTTPTESTRSAAGFLQHALHRRRFRHRCGHPADG